MAVLSNQKETLKTENEEKAENEENCENGEKIHEALMCVDSDRIITEEETLVCTEKKFDDNVVNRETFGQGVLESGCGKTVCGHDWMETYLDTLDEKELEEVKYEESGTRFKFGNGQVYKSPGRMIIPAVLGEKPVLIGTDVVETYEAESVP